MLATFLIPMSMYINEINIMQSARNHIERAIEVSAMASLYNVQTTVEISDIQKQQIIDDFTFYLSQNLNLDSNSIPQNSIIKDPIIIKEISVYDTSEVPTICPWGTEIRVAGIHVVVETKIKRNYMGEKYGEYVPIVIHKDIDIMGW